jgi:hypothetical protein
VPLKDRTQTQALNLRPVARVEPAPSHQPPERACAPLHLDMRHTFGMQMRDVEAAFNAAGVPFTWESPTEVIALGCHVVVDRGSLRVVAADPEGEVQRINEILGVA